MIFALAEFLKYQAANEEETVSMFDMAQNIFDIFRQQHSKLIRKFLARYMSRQHDLLQAKYRQMFVVWHARS